MRPAARSAASLIALGCALALSAAPAADELRPERTWLLAEPGRRLGGVAVSPDGRLAAVRVTGPGGDDLALVDLSTGAAGPRLVADPEPVSDPCWLPGERLAVVSGAGLRWWTANGRGGAVLVALPDPHPPVSLAGDGRRLALRCGQVVRVIATRDGATVATFDPLGGRLTALALSDDGETLVTAVEAGGAQRLTSWLVATGAKQAEVLGPAVNCLAASTWLEVGGPSGWRKLDLARLVLLEQEPTPVDLLAPRAGRAHTVLAGPAGLGLVGDPRRVAAAGVGGLAWAGTESLLVTVGDELRCYRWTEQQP